MIILLLLVLLVAGCGGRSEALPPILFLQADSSGAAQLFLQTDSDDPARQLTGLDDPAAPGLIDFAASPNGERIVYAVHDGANGSALRIMSAGGEGDSPLLDCPAAECSAPVWSPDGRRLIYERRPWADGRYSSPRLYWLDATTGETLPLLDEDTPSYGARFSPDGEWLSYVSPPDEGVVLYRLADGQQRLLVSRVGSPAAWSPNSAEVVVGDIVVYARGAGSEAESTEVGETSSVYLYRTIMTEESPREQLSAEASVADSVPAYSPDGQWIAFGRAPSRAAAGRQLWLMRPDGDEARALTADPSVSYGPPSWSPDGRTLLYQRFELDDPASASSVWVMDVATGEETLMAEGGYLPAWLP